MYAVLMWNHRLGHVAIITGLPKDSVSADDKVYDLLRSMDELPEEQVHVFDVDPDEVDDPVHGIQIHYRATEDNKSTLFGVRDVPWPVEEV